MAKRKAKRKIKPKHSHTFGLNHYDYEGASEFGAEGPSRFADDVTRYVYCPYCGKKLPALSSENTGT